MGKRKPKSTVKSRAAARKKTNSTPFRKGGAADLRSKTGTATRGPSGARLAYPKKTKKKK